MTQPSPHDPTAETCLGTTFNDSIRVGKGGMEHGKRPHGASLPVANDHAVQQVELDPPCHRACKSRPLRAIAVGSDRGAAGLNECVQIRTSLQVAGAAQLHPGWTQEAS